MIRPSSSRRIYALRTGAVLAAVFLADSGLGMLVPAPAAPAITAPFRDFAELADLADLADPGAIGDEVAGPSSPGATGAVLPPASIDPPAVSPGIPEAVLAAYRRAEATMAGTAPGCGLAWWMLAGIGKMESDHAGGGQVDEAGNTRIAIFGPWVDGSNGADAIPPGATTKLPAWERAAGPMQFLPETWAIYGAGGNPQNINDAALAAGRLLCAGGTNLAEPGMLAAALYRYNPSPTYVEAVMAWVRTYSSGPVVGLPPSSGTAPAPTAPAHSNAAADRAAASAVAFASAQLGLPYVWGGNGPDNGDAGFDCSGLTHAAYVAAGIPTPRTAQTQYDAGPRLPAQAPLQSGDLVFYGTPDRVHHVGLYIGDGQMINAPTFGKPVQIARYRSWGDDFVGATRPAALPGSLPLVPPGRTTLRAALPGRTAPLLALVPSSDAFSTAVGPLMVIPSGPATGQPVEPVPSTTPTMSGSSTTPTPLTTSTPTPTPLTTSTLSTTPTSSTSSTSSTPTPTLLTTSTTSTTPNTPIRSTTPTSSITPTPTATPTLKLPTPVRVRVPPTRPPRHPSTPPSLSTRPVPSTHTRPVPSTPILSVQVPAGAPTDAPPSSRRSRPAKTDGPEQVRPTTTRDRPIEILEPTDQ